MAGFGNYGIANMKAVGDQRTRFAALTKAYVQQAAEYIGVEIMNKTTASLQAQMAEHEATKKLVRLQCMLQSWHVMKCQAFQG